MLYHDVPVAAPRQQPISCNIYANTSPTCDRHCASFARHLGNVECCSALTPEFLATIAEAPSIGPHIPGVRCNRLERHRSNAAVGSGPHLCSEPTNAINLTSSARLQTGRNCCEGCTDRTWNDACRHACTAVCNLCGDCKDYLAWRCCQHWPR